MKGLLAAIFILVLSAVFTLLHRTIYQDRFEQKLTLQAISALKSNPALNGVTVRFKALDAILEGTVETPKERQEAQRLVDTIPGAHVVNDNNEIRVNPVLEFRTLQPNQFSVIGWLPPGSSRSQATTATLSARTNASWDWSLVQQDVSVSQPHFVDHPAFTPLIHSFANAIAQGRLLLSSSDISLDGTVRTEADRLHILALANQLTAGNPNGVHSRLQVLAPEKPPGNRPNSTSSTSEPASLADLIRQLQDFNVYFNSGATSLQGAEASKLTKLAAQLKRFAPQAHLQITGHADPSGNPKLNQQLSAKRAQNVAAQLARLGIPKSQLHLQAVGDTRPVTTTATTPGASPDSKRQSRRVEISLMRP